jgi:hypothetical protein
MILLQKHYEIMSLTRYDYDGPYVPPSPKDDEDDDLVVDDLVVEDATGDDDVDDDGPLVKGSDAPVEDSDADGESEDGEDDAPPVPSKTKNHRKTVVCVNHPVVVIPANRPVVVLPWKAVWDDPKVDKQTDPVTQKRYWVCGHCDCSFPTWNAAKAKAHLAKVANYGIKNLQPLNVSGSSLMVLTSSVHSGWIGMGLFSIDGLS